MKAYLLHLDGMTGNATEIREVFTVHHSSAYLLMEEAIKNFLIQRHPDWAPDVKMRVNRETYTKMSNMCNVSDKIKYNGKDIQVTNPEAIITLIAQDKVWGFAEQFAIVCCDNLTWSESIETIKEFLSSSEVVQNSLEYLKKYGLTVNINLYRENLKTIFNSSVQFGYSNSSPMRTWVYSLIYRDCMGRLGLDEEIAEAAKEISNDYLDRFEYRRYTKKEDLAEYLEELIAESKEAIRLAHRAAERILEDCEKCD